MQVDMHQLGAERPPSLLPFDSLLLPYPIDAKWRRKIAEAHSRRYTKNPTDIPSGLEYDEHYRASVEKRTYPGNAGVDIHPKRDGEAKSDDSTNRSRERGVYMGKGRAPTLDIGFLGHDFSEHPTAHMMEGAFVWQKRFSTTPVNNSQGGGRRSAFGGGRQWQRPPSVIEAVEKADEGEMTAFHSAGDVDITHSTLASCCRYAKWADATRRHKINTFPVKFRAGTVCKR